MDYKLDLSWRMVPLESWHVQLVPEVPVGPASATGTMRNDGAKMRSAQHRQADQQTGASQLTLGSIFYTFGTMIQQVGLHALAIACLTLELHSQNSMVILLHFGINAAFLQTLNHKE